MSDYDEDYYDDYRNEEEQMWEDYDHYRHTREYNEDYEDEYFYNADYDNDSRDYYRRSVNDRGEEDDEQTDYYYQQSNERHYSGNYCSHSADNDACDDLIGGCLIIVFVIVLLCIL